VTQIIKKTARVIAKILFGLALVIFFLIAGLLAFTQTSWFKSILTDQVVSMVNETINAKLSLESIEGNFFSSLIVNNGQLAFGDTVCVKFRQLKIEYDALALLDNKVHIDQIRLSDPYILAQADSAGVLNFSRIAKPSAPKPPAPVDSTAEPLGGFAIHLGDLIIENGHIVVDMPGLQKDISELNLQVKLDADSQRQSLRIPEFRFLVSDFSKPVRNKKPEPIRVRNLSLNASAHALPKSLKSQTRLKQPDTLSVTIDELRFITDRTDVALRARVILPDTLRGIALDYDASLRMHPLNLDDIRAFADIGLRDIRFLELETDLAGTDTSARLTNFKFYTPAGKLEGYASADFPNGPLRYEADLKFWNMNIGAFAENSGIRSNLNGRVTAKGMDIDPKKLITDVTLNLYDSRYGHIGIKNFEIAANVKSGTANLTRFSGVTSAGTFNCTGWYHLLNEEYQLETRFDQINLGTIAADSSLNSNINLSVIYRGHGLNPNTMKSEMAVRSDSSVIMGRRLDQLSIRGRSADRKFYIDEFKVHTPLVHLGMQGYVGLDSSVNMKYQIKTMDLSLLNKFAGQDSMIKDTFNLDLAYRGEIKGNMKQLETIGTIVVTGFVFGDVRVDSIQFSYYFNGIRPEDFMDSVIEFAKLDSHLFGDIYFYTRNIDAGGSTLRDLTLSITKENRKTLFEVSGYEPAMDAFASTKGYVVLEKETKGEVFLDNLYLKISGKNLKTKEVSVKLGEDPIIDSTYEKWTEVWQNKQMIDVVFDTEKNIYDIRSFSLDVGKGSIGLFGTFDITGDQNVDIKVKDLDLSRANALIGSAQSVIEGQLNLNASLKGSFEKPIIIADWSISNGKASEFVYDNFLGNMQYLNKKIQVNMTLNQNKDKTLTMGGYLPMDLSFKAVDERFTKRPMKFKIHSEGIDLRFLQTFFGKALTLNRGEIKIDMDVSGNREKPVLKGEMKIEDGMLTFPRSTIGQSFRNVRMFMRIKPDSIYLDTLTMQSGKDPKSNLFVDGAVNLADLMKNFDFSRVNEVGYNFQITFNDFIPINTKSETSYLHTAKITGVMDISAKQLYNTKVKGDLQIRNSQIWVVDPTRARSVSAVEGAKTSAVSETGEKPLDFYENLDLDLMISLPENSDNSIRSADMLLSLYGEIGVTKPAGSQDFFINGNVNTKKGGKYAYLNAAFNIETGEIIFTGEPGINPEINILAVKRFEYKDEENNPIPAEARIQVTGTLMKPQIAITAVERGTDDPLPGLTEPVDILSYLALGVRTKDLTKLGAEQAGDFAKQVAINQILNVVANKAGLQKLEYSAGTGTQGASIAVSKRISETISVSFEGGLEGGAGKNITLEISADSVWLVKNIPGLKKWKKTVELEYKTPDQSKTTQQEDIINFILYFKKEY